MIELISTTRCTKCDICVRVCPMNVFDSVVGEVPVIARKGECQTCFQCEVYCPADALFVGPSRTPEPADSPMRDEAYLAQEHLLGLYRDRVGWRRGRTDSSGSSQDPTPSFTEVPRRS